MARFVKRLSGKRFSARMPALSNFEQNSKLDAFEGNFGSRLRSLQGDLSRRAFAERLGVSDTMVKSYFDGSSHPRPRTLERLARVTGVHVKWLVTGKEPRSNQVGAALAPEGTQQERGGSVAMQVIDPTRPGADMVVLPRLAVKASAGLGLVAISEEIEGLVGLSRAYLRQIGVDPEHAHVLQVLGRSMAPTINDKDVVVIDTSKTTVHGEGIYTLVYGEIVLVKRLRMLRDGGVNIISDNKSEGYGDEFVSRSEMNTLRIVGQVKGQVRSL